MCFKVIYEHTSKHIGRQAEWFVFYVCVKLKWMDENGRKEAKHFIRRRSDRERQKEKRMQYILIICTGIFCLSFDRHIFYTRKIHWQNAIHNIHPLIHTITNSCHQNEHQTIFWRSEKKPHTLYKYALEHTLTLFIASHSSGCPSPSFTQSISFSFHIYSRIYFLFNSFSLGYK